MKNLIFALILLPLLAYSQQEINNPAGATYYIAYDSTASVYHVGITLPSQVTTTGQPNLEFNTDELEFLKSTQDIPVQYTALPDVGEEVFQGIYEYQGELVICRQDHIRTQFPPDQTPALFTVYRPELEGEVLEWIPSELVYVGNKRQYEDIVYICIQQHLTIVGQTPDLVPALWEVEASGTEWQVGVSYSIGDIVSYQGTQYECIQAHTAILGWEPPNVPALWQAQ